MKLYFVLAFTLFSIFNVLTVAQRSPFQPFESGNQKSGQYLKYEFQKASDVIRKSPYTPPPPVAVRPEPPKPGSAVSDSQHKSADTTTTTTPRPELGNRLNQQWDTATQRSPFRPPEKTAWREQQAAPVPVLVQSRVSEDSTRARSSFRGRRRNGRPAVSVYQNPDGRRDMHEADPGVTPWTRYTQSPRRQEEAKVPSWTPGATAQCGTTRYSLRREICCDGTVSRRRGRSPACCGTTAYDTFFKKCCNGVISLRDENGYDC